jgi:hypothetical protein
MTRTHVYDPGGNYLDNSLSSDHEHNATPSDDASSLSFSNSTYDPGRDGPTTAAR